MLRFLVLAALASARADSPVGRIIGGSAVTAPNYVVSVQYFGEHVCGGVIYKPNFVITAAQCVDGLEEKAITIRQNSVNHKKGGNIRYISEVHVHPDYDSDLKYNDIAIIKVQELVQASEVITLVAKNLTTETAKLQIYGWGKTREDGEELSDTLRKTDVMFYDRTKCKTELGSLSVNERMICTTIGSAGENACLGDEGGPLMKLKELYGIISWNRKCDQGPMVYTFIFPYLDWIKGITE